MAKDIRITVDDDTHDDWSSVKQDNEMTWEDVLKVGIETIKKARHRHDD